MTTVFANSKFFSFVFDNFLVYVFIKKKSVQIKSVVSEFCHVKLITHGYSSNSYGFVGNFILKSNSAHVAHWFLVGDNIFGLVLSVNNCIIYISVIRVLDFD